MVDMHPRQALNGPFLSDPPSSSLGQSTTIKKQGSQEREHPFSSR